MSVVYAVFQEGVYRHGCVGIFNQLEDAKKAADDAAHNMGDDGYHNYDVVPFDLNALYAVSEGGFDIIENAVLHSAKDETKRRRF